MKYVTIKRFKEKAICGDVNIPTYTECDCINNLIFYNNKPLCVITSENAHQYFAINDDGCGIERGKLTQEIQKILSKPGKLHQIRWNKIWADTIAQKYKRKEYTDYWLWNHEFFNADIKDLTHILEVIKNV